MSRMTSVNETKELLKFVEAASTSLAGKPNICTFGDLVPGSYLGLRWGLGDDCLLVLKLDEDFQPVNFQQALRASK